MQYVNRLYGCGRNHTLWSIECYLRITHYRANWVFILCEYLLAFLDLFRSLWQGSQVEKPEPKKWVKPPSAAIARSAIALPVKKYSKTKKEIKTRRHGFLEKLSDSNAPINVRPAGTGAGWEKQGIGWGFDIFQKFTIKFPAQGKIIPVNFNQNSSPQAAHCCEIS